MYFSQNVIAGPISVNINVNFRTLFYRQYQTVKNLSNILDILKNGNFVL